MSTPEIVKQLRDMAAQILTPSSHGKRFFTEAADRLEELEKSAEAMAVLEKCAHAVTLTMEIGVCHYGTKPQWFVGRTDGDSTESVMADTLPLALCQFAKTLFNKKGP